MEFMKSIGIETAMQLVDAHDKRAKDLAKEMRRWRKSKGLFSVHTKSCTIALRIWARTCLAVVKANLLENQQLSSNDGKGGVRINSVLDISLSDSHSMSTLGFPADGSVVSALDADQEVFMETMFEV